MDLHFEWDPEKAAQNFAKHGVSFEEALEVFYDPLLTDEEDRGRFYEEHRFKCIGRSYRQRILLVVYTQRREWVRIISARPATRAEVKRYEG